MAATQTNKKAPDSTLGAIVAHPLRSRCLTLLADRIASPAEIAEELGENLGNVSYHVKTLRKAGAVELVEEKPVRGAMEHFYRASVMPSMTDEENITLSPEMRQQFARQAFSLALANATASLDAKVYGQRHDAYAVRIPLRVDEGGWNELGEAYGQLVEQIFAIKEASAERMGDTEEIGIPVISFATFFEMPPTSKPTE